MTIETETVPAPKRGLLARSRGFLKVLAIVLAIAAVVAWVALGVGLYLKVETGPRFGLAIAAALSTEALFWTMAALLGVSVVEARKRIWRWITGRGGRAPDQPPQA